MAGLWMRQYLRSGCKIKANGNFEFSTTHPSQIKWRYQKGIEPNPNRFGPLTNLQDYSFVDGRPTPLSSNKYKRLKLQEEYCRKIVQLCSEIDFAVERHKKMKEDEELERKEILASKLKPKGDTLLKSEKTKQK